MNSELFLRDAITEFRKLKQQADRALSQVTPEELFVTPDPESNSLAILMKHISGNICSRWTGFLTSDGEKPDRKRDSEFLIEPGETAEDVQRRWDASWALLLETIQSLRPGDMDKFVLVRGERQSVPEALLRQLTHYAAHVGQIVYLAKHLAQRRWKTLSIPRGKSEEFNAQMLEKVRAAQSRG